MFSTQTFEVYGTSSTVSGIDVLASFKEYNVNSWGMFGALLAFVVLFRLNQYALLAQDTTGLQLPVLFGSQADALPATELESKLTLVDDGADVSDNNSKF